MAILRDLPNEILLSIIANVSPLYLGALVLSCKRIYGLCQDAIRGHDMVRSRLAGMENYELVRHLVSKPGLALYLLSLDFRTRDPWDDGAPEDLVDKINVQIRQNPHTASLKTKSCTLNAGDLAIPLIVTRLLNLRKISIGIYRQRHLLDTVSHIVQASHDSARTLTEPLALGRLRDAHIFAAGDSVHGMGLAILFSMIPTLRNLRVTQLASSELYKSSHRFHSSKVVDMLFEGSVDSNFLIELVRRTHALQKFAYIHSINNASPKIESRRLTEQLKQRAKQSLTFLKLLAEKGTPAGGQNQCRNYNDLSLGSLRDFATLKTLVTSVDMLIKTHDNGAFENRTGTVQRLTSWLPARLETLVLHQGLEGWDSNVLRMLFRGWRSHKRERIPNLKLINFVDFSHFDQVMPDDIKTACQETGVKVGYNSHLCKNPDCRQVLGQLE